VSKLDAKSLQLPLGVGTVVAGRYRIERTLAEGGMGVVFAATHIHLQQSVALKFLRGEVSNQWDALARFRAEAKAVAQLRSEHVAHVLDAGVAENGAPYMVMEYLEGRSLARTLQANGPLDVPTAVAYAIQACEGLAEAHSRGIVHRDIKPYNLFLVERQPGWYSIKIIDFGISKFAFSDSPNVVTGVIVGSPCYMSPEQLRSTATVDHRSDIWSLGATLYELLAGRAAFDASQTLPELVTSIIDRPAPPLHKVRPAVPEELAAVVARCLAKDRDSRYQTVGDLAVALLPFAPSSARVLAERAASMRPAFLFAATDPASEALAPAGEASGVPTLSPMHDDARNGPSIAPVTRPAIEIDDTPVPAPEAHIGPPGESADESDAEAPPLRRAPRWLGVASFGIAAAVLFGVILYASADNGGKSSAATKPTAQAVVAPAVTRPEAPPLPTATLAPVDSPGAEPVELVVRVSPSSARIAVDGTPVEGNPFRGPFPRSNEARRITATANGYESKSQDVTLTEDAVVDLTLNRRGTMAANRGPAPSTPTRAPKPAPAHGSSAAPAQSPAQTPIAATGGEVDSAGGRLPLRPIETKDPYRGIETKDPYAVP
jgi:eukaryotic-like serine/threonine-protein kinase